MKPLRNGLLLIFWIASSLTAGIIAIAPKSLKAQTTDEYQWRRLGATVWIDGSFDSYTEWRWTFKKNDSPINDTTYTINVAGTTYVCGIYADTVISEPDSTECWVVKYEYIEQPYSELVTRGPIEEAMFVGDSVEQCSTWVHVTNVKYTYPGFTYIHTEENTYYQQYNDGSVHNNAGTGVLFRDEPTKEKTYMVDNTIYYLTIPLDINEPINKPQTIKLKVYPNPANLYFNIQLPSKRNGVITLYDVNGKVIDKKIINNKNNVIINGNNIPSGEYLLIFTDENGTKVNKKITLIK